MNAPSAPDSWIGCSVDNGRYLLQERLGGGSMGDVFIALDTRIGQTVAIKILKSQWANTSELRRRFEHEVALIAALKSEHIVQIRDYGITPEGYPYYVMDYLTGQTLGDLMRQQGRLPVEQAVNFVIQTCSGLERAHGGVLLPNRGEMVKVVHRDLKPDNIFIAETSIGALVKILDFGIAKIHNMQRESTQATNMFIGTFRYASPEQVEVSQQLDARSDIYSLGIILYEMLSGNNPFGLDASVGEISQMTWAIAHASKPAIPLRQQPGCERLSPELEAVVMRCLEKNPQDRFASVQELRQALQAAVETKPSAAEMEPTVYKPLRPTDLSPDAEIGKSGTEPIHHSLPDGKATSSLVKSNRDPQNVAEKPEALFAPQPPAKPGRSLVVPMVLGFASAIAVSGFLLFQLLPKPPAPVPPQASPSSVAATPAEVPLPALVCDEPASANVSGKPSSQGPGYKYFGKLQKNAFVGRGTLIFDSGFRYDGDFQNGKKQGCGRFTYPPTDKTYRAYVGQFQNDFPNGVGTLVFSNNAKYVGQIRTEKSTLLCQGEGVMILTNGDRIGGTWNRSQHQESQGKYSCTVLPP